MSAERIDIRAIGVTDTELARYRTTAGERALIGRRTTAGVEVSDRPLGDGHIYLVDRGFRCMEQLQAFVADYLRQAVRLDAPPMSGQSIAAMLAGSESAELEALLGEGS